MHRFGLYALICCSIVTLAGCGEKVTRVTEQDNGKTVTINTGAALSLELYGNPTTGYSWELADTDGRILQQAAPPRYRADSQLTGSGGMFTYQFKGISRGRSALKFVYRRPWEKNVPPINTFEVSVIVE